MGLAAELKQPKTRIVLAITFMVITVGMCLAIYLLNNNNVKQVASTVAQNKTSTNDGGGGKEDSVSEEYRRVIEADNKNKLEKAKAEGGSVIPKVLPTSDSSFDLYKNKASESINKNPPAPPVEKKEIKENGKRVVTQADIDRYMAEVKSREDRMKNTLQTLTVDYWGYGNVTGNGAMTVAAVSTNISATANNGGGGISSSQLSSGNNKEQCLVIRSGVTCYAQLTTGLNSDDSMWASASVLQCKTANGKNIAGAVLSGVGKVNSEWSNGVQFEFNTLASPIFTKSLSVKAVSLDEQTGRPAVASDKDSHIGSKILAASVLGMSKGANEALKSGGRNEQLIDSSNGQVVQTDSYTNKQIAIIGATEAAVVATKPLESVVNRPTTHSIENGRTIGVYFMADVFSDCQ